MNHKVLLDGRLVDRKIFADPGHLAEIVMPEHGQYVYVDGIDGEYMYDAELRVCHPPLEQPENYECVQRLLLRR